MIQKIFDILTVEREIHDLHAVIFDLDDTLYAEKDYVRSGYCAISKSFSHIQNMEEKLWTAFQEGKKAIDEVLISEDCYSEENLQRCVEIYRNHQPEIALYSGVREMLLRIKTEGKKLGLITDGRPVGQRNKIASLCLEELFDEIIVTDELGGEKFRKPHPLAFEWMQERLCIPFEKMCYVGDNLSKDFCAPQSLNMRSIWFQNKDGLYYQE